jgi:hypothetical protein
MKFTGSCTNGLPRGCVMIEPEGSNRFTRFDICEPEIFLTLGLTFIAERGLGFATRFVLAGLGNQGIQSFRVFAVAVGFKLEPG